MSYEIKVWRNPPDQYTPTINEIVDDEQLVDWLEILSGNILAKTTEPLVQKIEIIKRNEGS